MYISGEEHYNIISALHKSLRGSDDSAALYWLARMLEGGETPLYVARRLVRFASEDIGMDLHKTFLIYRKTQLFTKTIFCPTLVKIQIQISHEDKENLIFKYVFLWSISGPSCSKLN